MNKPIAVFDAGLGSYAIVEAIKKAYPQQDIIYKISTFNKLN